MKIISLFLIFTITLFAIKEDGFYGDIRSQYISKIDTPTKVDSDSQKAFGFGTNIGYLTSFSDSLKFEVEVGYTLPFYEFAAGDAARFGIASPGGEYVDNFELKQKDSRSYLQLSSFNLQYASENLSTVIGAQDLNTPLTKAHDIRLVPNRFFAAFMDYTLNDTMHFQAFESLSMAGALDNREHGSNNDKAGHYSSMAKAVENQIDEDVEVAGLGFLYEDSIIKSNSWFYFFTQFFAKPANSEESDNHTITIIYTDIDYKLSKNTRISAQYINAEFPKKYQINRINDFSIFGLKGEQKMGDFTLIGAYNVSVGDGSVLDVWGARPEYAVAEEFWWGNSGIDMIKASAFKVGVDFRATKNLMIKTAAIEMQSDRAIADKRASISIWDVSLNYQAYDALEVYLLNESITYQLSQKTLQNNQKDSTIFKMGMRYHF
jgi:hypothetical protein